MPGRENVLGQTFSVVSLFGLINDAALGQPGIGVMGIIRSREQGDLNTQIRQTQRRSASGKTRAYDQDSGMGS
jgi:hypothetical protein